MPSYGPADLAALERALARARPQRPEFPATREAAVLAPLFVSGGELRVVLTKKAAHLRTHRGEMAFPGGGREPDDPDLLATALREAEEEVGLRPDAVRVLGPLDDLPTASGRYMVRPFVGVVPDAYPYVRDPVEVDRIVDAPLARFADTTRRRTEYWEHNGTRHLVYFFDDVSGETVWGATARMLVGLVDLLEGAG